MFPYRASKGIAWVCMALCCGAGVQDALAVQADRESSNIKIVVLQGEGAINNVRGQRGEGIVIRVEKEDGTPVPGAAVVFTLPLHGPTGEFANSGKTFTVQSDAQGTAAVKSFRPANVAGKMEVRVNASFEKQTARATVTQFNMVVQNSGGGHGKLIAILLLAGAAGGAAAGITMSRSGRTATGSAALPVITISPADNSIGPPR